MKPLGIPAPAANTLLEELADLQTTLFSAVCAQLTEFEYAGKGTPLEMIFASERGDREAPEKLKTAGETLPPPRTHSSRDA
jgi:hypothetical protein